MVGNNPICRIDFLGLWLRGDHETATRGAWEQVVLPQGMQTYGNEIVNALVQYNANVDKYLLSDNRWHFNRDLNADVQQAIRAYTALLSQKERGIGLFLSKPNKSRCSLALEAMGNLTHAYQDYYAHAVSMEYTGLSGAADVGRISGTPHAPGAGLKPSSYGSIISLGEHGPPPEPGSRAVDAAQRRQWSMSYTQERLLVFLPEWWNACQCYAKDLFGH
jgi:hypothetical protein